MGEHSLQYTQRTGSAISRQQIACLVAGSVFRVFAVRGVPPGRSSAARAALREQRSLLRLFSANNACDRRARPPCLFGAISSHAPRGARAFASGIIGPKQT
ncbi:hypothetical protein PSN_1516 [Pseudomonas sp. NGC7]